MQYIVRCAVCYIAARVFVGVRKFVARPLLATLPQDHPLRVMQVSLYERLDDSLVLRSFRPSPPTTRPRGSKRRVAVVQVAALILAAGAPLL